MQYKALFGLRDSVSCLCLGTGDFGVSVPEADAFALLDAFCANGGNFIDTARVYGDYANNIAGISEQVIGRWRRRNPAVPLLVSTKGGHPHLNAARTPRLSAREIADDAEQSLRALGMEAIDLYWLHRDDPTRPAGELVEAVAALVRQGKVRQWGVSNWRPGRFAQAVAYATCHGLPAPVASQIMGSLAEADSADTGDDTMTAWDEEARAYYAAHEIPVMLYSVQARGFFAKLQASGVDGLPEPLRRIYGSEENLQCAQRLFWLAHKRGASVQALALAWAVHQPHSIIPVFSARNLAQLQDSLCAAELCLTPEEAQYLRQV